MTTLSRLEAVTERKRDTEAGWNRLIHKALEEGHSLRTVAVAAGVSHAAIAKKAKTH